MPRHMPTRPILLALAVLTLQALFCHHAFAWWNGDWNYRVRIDADTTAKGAAIAGAPGHMAVLVRLHSGNFDFSGVKDDGSDLRVVAADDRTPLHFQIERFDGLIDQVGLLWVDVPSIAANATTSFYLYWGNKNAVSGSDGKATFAGDDLLVYHFAEQSGPPADTTSYGNNALSAAKRVDGGMIGSGVHLDGKTSIPLPQTPSLSLPAAAPVSFSLWMRPDDNSTGGTLYDSGDATNGLRLFLRDRVLYATITTAGTAQTSPAGPALSPGWHLATLSAGPALTLYLDGMKYADLAVPLPALAHGAMLGAAMTASATPGATPGAAAPTAPASPPAGAAAPTDAATPPPAPAATPDASGFAGTIDEFRIVKSAANPAELLARVHAEGPSPNLVALGKPEQASVFGSGYIGIILRSVTADAWVVIGLLGVMSLISWVVMIGKGVYVTRTSRANTAFSNAYRTQVAQAHGDLLGVMRGMEASRQPAWSASSLMRINAVATSEIDDRLQGGRVEPSGMLAAQSIAAIRSALDARMANEVQRLNRMMVLLTIAIAGGPFIGLLGTVIGVMITFAAIAQAGDVNVNAIAPGISAALLATVAGLAVAIPALFGYNYFNTRITDAIVDMQVHIDMLVARMGEGLIGRRPQAGE